MSERFSLSISALLPGVPPLERAGRAVDLGYRTLETWWPWPQPVPGPVAMGEFVSSFVEAGARLHLLNLWEGDASHGGRGLAGLPDAGEVFWANAAAAVELGSALGARYLNVLAGNVGPRGRAAGLEVLESRLVALAALAQPAALGLVVEQLNATDHPDYLLTEPDEVLAVVRRVRPQVSVDIGMLADVYHLAHSGVDPAGFIAANEADIGHVQLADYPGRGRPGTGMLDMAGILDSVKVGGYRGFLGLEFLPATDDPLQLESPDRLWLQLTAPLMKDVPRE
ncbi:TIM barrel protein [Lysinimonas soli]|uniref:TIM barrel protein n=1 Tax=Lysinimonas soli TaxID=1074233 RepID=A0ABW0NNQ7_9MICO